MMFQASQILHRMLLKAGTMRQSCHLEAPGTEDLQYASVTDTCHVCQLPSLHLQEVFIDQALYLLCFLGLSHVQSA